MAINDIEKTSVMPEGNARKTLSAGLYIVATPIGNLRDITLRALDVLRDADIVLCEDTRVTRKLMGAYQIKQTLHTYHDHSDDKARVRIMERVQAGQVVALVSDAGMPIISDPGYKLVKDMRAHDLPVTTVPGANAPLAALQLSGLPSDQFSFLGFLPSKTKARKDKFAMWDKIPATLIAFDTAARLLDSLRDIHDVMGVRMVAVVREITKLYEETRKDTPQNLIDYYNEHGLPRGEIVLVIAPPKAAVFDAAQVDAMLGVALENMKTKDAAAQVAEHVGWKKNDVYARALVIKNQDGGVS